MSIVVKNKYLQIAPRKVRAVCDLIRKRPAKKALEILRYNDKKQISIVLAKLINSGLAQASEDEKYDLENLTVSKVFVDEGPTMKRIMPRAQGRAFRVRHRASHITIELKEA